MFLPRSSFPVRPGGVRLVAQHRIRSGAGPSGAQAWHRESLQQVLQHRGVTGLTSGQGDHQRPAPAVNELVDLAAQPTPGAAERMVQRLGLTGQNLVIRLSPL
jgi:hypothetical protein